MDWLFASAVAAAIGTAGPLLVAAAVLHQTGLAGSGGNIERWRALRRLRLATAASLLPFAVWFWLDRTAIMQGRRSFVVAGAVVLCFAVLFVRWAWPVIAMAGQPASGAEGPPPRRSARPPVPDGIRRITFLLVGLLLALAIAAVLTSTHDLGYRLKSALMLVAGMVFFAVELRRAGSSPDARALASAFLYFLALLTVAVITVTLDWTVTAHRILGVIAQAGAGVLGLVGCARILKYDAR